MYSNVYFWQNNHQSEWWRDMDLAQKQCSGFLYNSGAAAFPPASQWGQRGAGNLPLPWLGHLRNGELRRLSSHSYNLIHYQGTWTNFTLQSGRYCNIRKSLIKDGLKLIIEKEELHSSPYLRYSPPSYHSYGLPPTQSDPFEMNTVEVNCSERYK